MADGEGSLPHLNAPPQGLVAEWSQPGRRIRLYDDGDKISVVVDGVRSFEAHPGQVWTRHTPRLRVTASLRDHRLEIYLLSGGRIYTLSATPSQVCGHLAPTAEQVPVAAAFGERLLELAGRHGLTAPAEPQVVGLGATVAALAYPMLVPAIDAGAEVPLSIPPTLSPALRSTSVRACADRLYGRRAHRHVVRTLAQRLSTPVGAWSDLHGRRMALGAPAIAAIAGADLHPDLLVEVIGSDDAWNVECRHYHELHAKRSLVRRFLGDWPPRRRVEVVLDALAHPDGLPLLVHAAQTWTDVGRPNLTHGPATIRSVHDDLLDLAIGPFDDPSDGAEFDHHPDAIRFLGGRLVDGHTLRLPRTVTDLEMWGARLSNCLGSYAPTVGSGTAWIVGLFLEDELRWAAEVTPDCRLRQLKGFANVDAPAELRTSMAQVLEQAHRRHGDAVPEHVVHVAAVPGPLEEPF